jgi:hypothetical protein
MSDKNKNIRSLLKDLFRYRRNELSESGRNAFERELQRDPFLSEASEGFESITPEEAKKDIADLQRRLKTGKVKKQRFVFYRIAASIAVLMILSAVYLFVSKNKTDTQLAQNNVKPETIEIVKNQPVVAPVDSEMPDTQKILAYQKKADKPTSKGRAEETVSTMKSDEKTISAAATISDTTPELYAEPAKAYISEKRSAAPLAAISGKRSQEQDKEDVLTDYTPPQPVMGKADFDRYILNNLHRPDSATTGQRVVVVVSFLVRTDGTIDSIKIVRSPGRSFSDEAIRVIKEGPAWKPAKKNGTSIEEEVRERIVFR